MKPLVEADALILRDFAQSLPALEVAGIYPEDEFEARLVLGYSARSMLVRETPAEQSVRVRYLLETIDIVRSRTNVTMLQQMYEGRCQLCGWDPRDIYGHPLCHGHHIQWLSRGGADDLDNMVLICPNHHAAVHRADAVFDYESKAFEFSNGSCEYLQLDRHLPAAA